MAIDVLERIETLGDEREQLLDLHFGAMRVLDSRHRGSLGTFRVDGLGDAQADVLQDYVGQFAGGYMPKLTYDESGQIVKCGSARVNESDTKFSQVRVYVDEESGETRRYFSWDNELWDDEAAAEVAKSQRSKDSRTKITKVVACAYFGGLLALEAVGFGMLLKGGHEVTQLEKIDAPKEAVAAAKHTEGTGINIIMGVPLAFMGGMIPLAIAANREQRKENERRDRLSKIKGAF